MAEKPSDLAAATPVGRLGDSPEQVAEFQAYIAAFNAGDLDRFPQYYTDDIVFDLTVAPVFHGKAQVIGFYRQMYLAMREQVTVEKMSATPDTITVDIDVLFTAFKDAPDFPVRPMMAGDTLIAKFDVAYKLRDGLVYALKVTPK